LQIVKVQYHDGVSFFGREDTYFSVDELKVGNIVTVPVGADGVTKKAQVLAINVPEKEIEAFRATIKTIPEKSVVYLDADTIRNALDFLDKVDPIENYIDMSRLEAGIKGVSYGNRT